MKEPSPDVVIVGGGLIGCSAAYFLSRRGARVLLLEKGGVGGETSSGAAGMLGVDSEPEEDPVCRAFARQSRSLYESLAEVFRREVGVDIQFEGKGLLSLARDEKEESEFRQREAGGHGSFWSPDEVRAQCPDLAEPFRGGLFHSLDGQVTASRVAEGFRRAAESLGAVVRENTKATGLIRQGNRVTGVRVGRKSVFGGTTLLALGPKGWSLASATGWRPPIFPVRGEILIFRPSRRLLPFPVFLGDSGFYLVPKPDGTFLAGTTVRRTNRAVLTNRGKDAISRAALAALPALADAPYMGGWAGLRPGTPDGWPLLGPVPGVEGLWIAAGHFRRGVLLTPATGLWISEAMNGAPPSGFDRFSPGRFTK